MRRLGARVDRMPVSLAVGKRTLVRPSEFTSAPTGRSPLLADAEFGDHRFVPLRVVLLQVVEQAATPADHHEKSPARAVILLVRFEVFRQLTDALAQKRDLNFGTPGVGSMCAIRVNDGLLSLSG